jgi:small-conductance mechanosensitive channel
VVSAVVRLVIWVTAVLMVLAQLDIRLTALVASATVVGAALGFGAQTLVKDFLSGLLILAEDQYGVGDTIEIGTLIATVEAVTLRVTRLRAVDGVVWYVPNGDIRKVGNHSDGTSQAVVDLVVPAGTDLVRAGEVAVEVGARMAEDPLWAHELVSLPTFAGVQEATATDVTLRFLAQTPAGHHFRVARELRLRVLSRFLEDGIAWAPAEPELGSAVSEGNSSPPRG